MVEKLESVAIKGAIDLNDTESLALKNYDPLKGRYEPLTEDRAVYSCDAACKNCHCATF